MPSSARMTVCRRTVARSPAKLTVRVQVDAALAAAQPPLAEALTEITEDEDEEVEEYEEYEEDEVE